MRPAPNSFLERSRVVRGEYGSDASYGNNGAFYVTRAGVRMTIFVSDGGGWDHVSVSCAHRCPTWAEMCWVKDLFFGPEEVVCQFHPKESEYVNLHPNCLHLWRCQEREFPTPPSEFVGPK